LLLHFFFFFSFIIDSYYPRGRSLLRVPTLPVPSRRRAPLFSVGYLRSPQTPLPPAAGNLARPEHPQGPSLHSPSPAPQLAADSAWPPGSRIRTRRTFPACAPLPGAARSLADGPLRRAARPLRRRQGSLGSP